jgi:rare lipoprotein A
MIKLLAIFSFFLFTLVGSNKLYTGTASYYGKNYTGRLTASGERFHKDSLTAAHKYFKFGTVLKVTNLINDSVRFVKVNDRLPKSSKFIIDLSYGTAAQLNFLKRNQLTPVLKIKITTDVSVTISLILSRLLPLYRRLLLLL